jgi:tetratricopeptide (TPR) repeat protein
MSAAKSLQLPAERDILIAEAEAAVARTDWPASLQYWQLVLSRFPDCVEAYIGAATVLCALGRYDEADAVTAPGYPRFAASMDFLAARAWAANGQGAVAEARSRWAELRNRFPASSIGWLGAIDMWRRKGRLPQAETIAAAAAARFPTEPAVLREWATLADERCSWSEALTRWEAFKDAAAESSDGYAGIVQALLKLDRAADAEVVLTSARRLFPDAPRLDLLYARAGSLVADRAESQRRWDGLLARFADDAEIWLHAAENLLERNAAQDAENLLAQAIGRFPDNLQIACCHAQAADRRGDWVNAIQRWSQAAARFPEAPEPHIGLANAAWDGALSCEKEFRARRVPQPRGELVTVARAEIIQRAGRMEAAEAAWREGIAKFPESLTLQRRLVSILRSNGKFDEAIEATERFIGHSPDDFSLLKFQALTYADRRSWPQALACLDRMVARFGAGPKAAQLRQEVARVLLLARTDQGAADPALGSPFEIPESLARFCDEKAPRTDALRDLVMAFESLGNGCEFGLVQRRCGAEPISLLRWSTVPSLGLIDGLAAGWEGIGEPGQTVLSTEERTGELYTLDDRYKLRMHTFTLATQVDREKFFKQQCRRLTFLRRQFLDDVTAGERIYVYRCFPIDDLPAILAGLRRYNPANRLLCVCKENSRHKAGVLTTLGDGLYLGAIKRFSQVNTDYQSWLSLCEQMHAATGRPAIAAD